MITFLSASFVGCWFDARFLWKKKMIVNLILVCFFEHDHRVNHCHKPSGECTWHMGMNDFSSHRLSQRYLWTPMKNEETRRTTTPANYASRHAELSPDWNGICFGNCNLLFTWKSAVCHNKSPPSFRHEQDKKDRNSGLDSVADLQFTHMSRNLFK